MPYEKGAKRRDFDVPLYLVKGREISARDPALQDALALVYNTPERPRCMCVRGGVEMYVAQYETYVVKRLPNDARSHDARCPHYEPPPGQSGLGELIGEAVIEGENDTIELKTGFPLVRISGRASASASGLSDPKEVTTRRKRLSLRGLLHFLWHRAQFNRWYPAMLGKRNWGVIAHHLHEAAKHVTLKNQDLSHVMYVPEPFSEEKKALHAAQRAAAFGPLNSPEAKVQFRLMVVVGEFKLVEPVPGAVRLLVKHMPDCPFLVAPKAWDRMQRVFAPLLQAKAVENQLHIVMAALIYAKRESVFEVASATMMLTTPEWLPLEGMHELPLIKKLIDEERRFVKPLRFEADGDVHYPTALMTDTDPPEIPLYTISVHDSEQTQLPDLPSRR
jgi:hypothetical protein